MKIKNFKSLTLPLLCLLSAYGLAYTSQPCDPPNPPTGCSGNGEGAQCGSGGVIVISEPVVFAYYYCGGNTPGRCGGPGSGGTCSELLFKMGKASHIQCMAGDTVIHDYGWCFVGNLSTEARTGYDCGGQICNDVPDHTTPNIVGKIAGCPLMVGTYPYPITVCMPDTGP